MRYHVNDLVNLIKLWLANIKRRTVLMVAFIICFVVLFITVTGNPFRQRYFHGDLYDPPPALPLEFILGHSAQYATFFPPKEPYAGPPESCRISQVNILQRHGSRYPTLGASAEMVLSVEKLRVVHMGNASGNPLLGFLPGYKYTLGVNDLLDRGAEESQLAGREVYRRYCLKSDSDCGAPFVRASQSRRVVESAQNWTLGYASEGSTDPSPVLEISEVRGFNNTLENYCPNSHPSRFEQEFWLSAFAPRIIQRLDAEIPSKSILTHADVINYAHLCAFESLASGVQSPFCRFFERSDWEFVEYHGDLGKFYGWGPGARLGRAQGVGYVNELLARLTNDLDYALNDKTQVNQTMAADPSTFPLNSMVNIDFSHDNQMTAIVSLLALFSSPSDPHPSPSLHPFEMDRYRKWIFSKIAPFAGRIVFERIECGEDDGVEARNTYVRILGNDEVLDLSELCPSARRKNVPGMCRLEEFVDYLIPKIDAASEEYPECFSP